MNSDASSTDAIETIFENRIKEARISLDRLFDARSDALGVMKSIKAIVAQGGHVYTCGNGGSAAQALHFSEELIGRYRKNRRPLPGLCLNADPTALTCIANDFGFDSVFARQAEALLRPEDCLVVFSTSGRSANILKALQVAAQCGARRIGFLGGDGGPALEHCEESVVIPGEDTAAIQEAHQTLLHACCEFLENS